jgi:two-component system cell cycle response regulator
MQSIAASTWGQRLRTRFRKWSLFFHQTAASGSETSSVAGAAPGLVKGGTAATVGPHGKKILVVDDNAFIIKTLSFKLKSAGYAVISAEDGGTAVSIARKEKPDLILLDICFPPDVAHGGGVAWDGFLIIDWLRRLDEGKDVPIIIISGGDPAKYKQRALAKGAHSFFHKPIDHEELLRSIQRIFDEKAAKTATQTA